MARCMALGPMGGGSERDQEIGSAPRSRPGLRGNAEHARAGVRRSRPLPAICKWPSLKGGYRWATRYAALRHKSRTCSGLAAGASSSQSALTVHASSGKRLTRPRSAILCAAMRLQIAGTQRYLNNILSQPPRLQTKEACCSTTVANSQATTHASCQLHGEFATATGMLASILHRAPRPLCNRAVAGRRCAAVSGYLITNTASGI